MSRYSRIPITKTTNDPRLRYTVVKYPTILPSALDVYVYTTQGDRYDVMAQNYYNDSTLWWMINRANPNQDANSIFPTAGAQIRIPSFDRVGTILAQFDALNKLI
jgi:hypothetical protein